MSEANYMDEISPYTFREAKAHAIRPILREQLEIAARWAIERPGRQRGAASRV